MKKIIKMFLGLVVVLIIIIVKHKDIYKAYKTNQISKMIINCLNGNFSNMINEYTINRYKIIHMSNQDLNHNNITKQIEVYINDVINGMNIYIRNNEKVIVNRDMKSERINNPNDIESGKDIYMTYYKVDYAVGESFTSNDVKNYKDGIFKDLLIEKLKECLDYEEIDGKINWFINSTEDKIIELPYDCYIDYKAYNYQIDKNFKKAINIVDKKKINLDKLGNIVTVKFLLNNGNEITQNIDVVKWDDGKYRISLLPLGKTITYMASSELCSHTLERWVTEAEIAFFEEYPIWKHENEEMDILDRIIESREAEENKEE